MSPRGTIASSIAQRSRHGIERSGLAFNAAGGLIGEQDARRDHAGSTIVTRPIGSATWALWCRIPPSSRSSNRTPRPAAPMWTRRLQAWDRRKRPGIHAAGVPIDEQEVRRHDADDLRSEAGRMARLPELSGAGSRPARGPRLERLDPQRRDGQGGPGGRPEPYIVHIEFLSGRDLGLPERGFWYNTC